MTDNFMIIDGTRYPVINAWIDKTVDDRKRWIVVTEEPTITAIGEPFPGFGTMPRLTRTRSAPIWEPSGTSRARPRT
jgi:hypothetical protein